MVEALSFHELFTNLINKLKTHDKVKDVSSHFTASHSLEDMFSYLWKLEEAHTSLTPRIVKAEKSEAEAEKFRTEGNKYYQKKCLEKAVNLYNQSIMFAPHPEIPLSDEFPEKSNRTKETEDLAQGMSHSNIKDESRSLSLGYANRSAVLFELGQYEKCINDINYALIYGYPKILHSKLAERKAKCLIALEREDEAKSLVESSLQALNNLSLDEAKTKTSKETLQALLQECQQQKELKRASLKLGSITSSDTKCSSLFCSETPNPPLLADCHSSIPSLSSAVGLAFSPSQGRHLIAKKDIKPGDVLIVEEAYSKVLQLDSALHTYCTDCLARCITPLPCPACSKVIFCSSACRMRALASYHGPECKILASLSALDMGKNSVLACRTIIQTTIGQLQELVPAFLIEAANKSPESLGFDTTGRYNSSDYRTIYHLVGNMKARSVSDLFKRCAMAFTVVKLLEQSCKFFVDGTGAPFIPSLKDLLLTGCALFTHMMNLPCNAHSITELQVNANSYQQSLSKEIGCGAFGVLSLTNHSCNPSAARFSFGATVALIAVRFIPAGTEVTDCYGEHYGLSSAEVRSNVLKQQYYFPCCCEACQNHWPTYSDLPVECRLKCTCCSQPIDCVREKCLSCELDYTQVSRNEALNAISYSCLDVTEQLKHIKAEYESTYENVLKGDICVNNVNKICEIIEFIDRYIQQPCKVYFEAQETLKHCFERQGSSYIGGGSK